MTFFIYRYAFISFLSFFLSNLLYLLFEFKFDPIYASFFALLIVLNVNIFFFFKLKLFKKNKKNYFKIVLISFSFRCLEYLVFNISYSLVFNEFRSNYIFLLTLILSFLIKSIVFYKSSDLNK